MQTIIDNGTLKATIASKGAELISLQDASGREYMWSGDPDFWPKHSPVLFPIVGTLKDNRYSHQGKTYALTRHGFARDKDFTLVESGTDHAVFLLESDPASLERYPFPFELRLTYTLHGDSLRITYNVSNTGGETMWFSIGGHPAFALPGDFTSYSVGLDTPEILNFHLLENDLLSDTTGTLDASGGSFALSYPLFENDALVFKKRLSDKMTLRKEGKDFLEVDLTGFPNLGLWTKPGAAFLCIEPWHGYSDTVAATGELSEKEGMLPLEPERVFEASFNIRVRV